MDKQAIIDRVRRNLGKHPIPDVGLEVVEDRIRQENGFWYVPVRPTATLSRSFEFYDALATPVDELDSEESLNMLLVSVLSGSDE